MNTRHPETVPPVGTVLYTTEEAGAVVPTSLTRPLPADGSAPPLVLRAHGATYQLSLIVHHRHKTGGFAHV